jgi:hypothetical protein
VADPIFLNDPRLKGASTATCRRSAGWGLGSKALSATLRAGADG